MVREKILITGASGYIGKEMTGYLLKRGYALNLLTRDKARIPLDLLKSKSVNIFVGSLGDKNVLKKATVGVKAVLHLAACLSVFEKKNRLFETNQVGLNNVLWECKKTNQPIRFVFASSVDVGKKQSDYAKSKLKGEEIVKKYSSNSKIGYTIVRIGNVYKAGENGVLKGVEDVMRKDNWKSSVLYYLLDSKKIYLIEMMNLIKKLTQIMEDSNSVNKTVLLVEKTLTIKKVLKDLANRGKVVLPPKRYFGLPILLRAWFLLAKIFRMADLLVYLYLEK